MERRQNWVAKRTGVGSGAYRKKSNKIKHLGAGMPRGNPLKLNAFLLHKVIDSAG